jgi:hypothetical protein
MDTRKLVVGHDVFMRSGGYGDWGKVVEVTPTGVIVQSDPCYGDELIRFDKHGTACDSSDIDIDRYKDIALFDYDRTGHLPPHRAIETLTLIDSRISYPKTTRRKLFPVHRLTVALTIMSSGSVFGKALNA